LAEGMSIGGNVFWIVQKAWEKRRIKLLRS
jgi:hypothetical protein